ncbi:MAG: hypothetical protein R3B91_23020 [Planctomycetaceae bacterium]
MTSTRRVKDFAVASRGGGVPGAGETWVRFGLQWFRVVLSRKRWTDV